MQTLSLDQQESVLHFIEQLSTPNVLQSDEQLEELLLEGLDSLERGEGIEATDEWWEKEHENLPCDRVIANAHHCYCATRPCRH
jgi:hypothetical protein